jgi:tetratricopeptide (TPR) repeat protein
MAEESGTRMDPALPVVRLCVEGMRAEADGRADAAHALFRRAWDIAADDYEACIAAHYLARHQSSTEETLRWNQECLDRADLVGDERVRGFYPSLYVNIGHAYQKLGQLDLAHACFVRAAECVSEIPEGQYGDWNRFAVAAGLRSTAAAAAAETVVPGSEVAVGAAGEGGGGQAGPWAVDERIGELLARWCARAELQVLGLTLPAYLGYLGTDDDRLRLRTALHMVHAARRLPEDEQTALGEVIGSALLR